MIIAGFRKYKLTVIGLVTMGIVCLPLNYIAMDYEHAWAVYIMSFFLGFWLSPLVPVMLELSCEIVYPLSGSFSVGTMYSGATILSVVNA